MAEYHLVAAQSEPAGVSGASGASDETAACPTSTPGTPMAVYSHLEEAKAANVRAKQDPGVLVAEADASIAALKEESISAHGEPLPLLAAHRLGESTQLLDDNLIVPDASVPSTASPGGEAPPVGVLWHGG